MQETMMSEDHAARTSDGQESAPAGPPNIELWTREGFLGDSLAIIRPHHTPDYLRVEGPHAPRRLNLAGLEAPDAADPWAMPLVLAEGRTGLRISLSTRHEAMPFTFRNVETDEIHFVQEGSFQFQTDCGTLDADPGDFIVIPRSVAYRVTPATAGRVTIVESPGAMTLDTPTPVGMINPALDISYPSWTAGAPPLRTSDRESVLLLKSFDGITRFTKAEDPLAIAAIAPGPKPVWKINLSRIQPATYHPKGGPPSQFMTSSGNDLMFYTMSARPTGRAPIHHNADYDEIVLYHAGPGAWGAVNTPGTMTWVPKGVTHHGPDENVPEGYLAWLLECRDTLRFSDAAVRASELIETSEFGRHPTAND
jgi:homogentisate 1,2-dioxygenase